LLTDAIAKAVHAKPKDVAHGEVLRLLKVEVAHGRLPQWVKKSSLRRIGAIRREIATSPDLGMASIGEHKQARG
jgi:hypothetical protein